MSLGQKRVSIGGDPGTAWTNGTSKTMWQLVVAWENTCGRCAEYDRRIAVWWPIPFHHGCNCSSVPVPPGATALPFVDFRDEIAKLDPGQQAKIMGAMNKKLVDSGVLKWDQVVGRSKILTFQEAVAQHKLTRKQLSGAGIPGHQIDAALLVANSPENVATFAEQRALIEQLKKMGVKKPQVGKLFMDLLSGNIGGSGPGGPLNPPPAPPAPKPKPAPKPPGQTTPGPVAPDRKRKPLRAEKPATPMHLEAAPKPKETTVPAEPPPRMRKPLRAEKPPTPPHQEAAPPKSTGDGWPPDPAKLRTVRGLGGSTGAELVTDGQGQWVRKRGKTPGHLRSEDQADRIYRALGVDVPDSRLYDPPGEGPTKLGVWIEGTRPLSALKGAELEAARAKLREGFALDALLGNWDVIGLKSDNILVGPDGRVYRVDNGGALAYRAQGAKKSGTQWGPAVGELSTMKSSAVNPSASAVFGALGPKEIEAQVDALLAKRATILGAADAETRKALAARLDWLAQWSADKKAAAVAPKPPANPPPAPAVPLADIKGFTPTPPKTIKKFSTGGEKGDKGKSSPDTWGKANFASVVANDLTPQEQRNITTYTGNTYKYVNARARGLSEDSRFDPILESLRSGLAKGKAPEPFLAWRGIRRAAAANVDFDAIGPGSILIDAAVQSVSLSRKIAQENFGGGTPAGVLFRIVVPKGTPGLYLNAGGLSSIPKEKEFAMPPGATKLVVTGKRVENGVRIVECEVRLVSE